VGPQVGRRRGPGRDPHPDQALLRRAPGRPAGQHRGHLQQRVVRRGHHVRPVGHAVEGGGRSEVRVGGGHLRRHQVGDAPAAGVAAGGQAQRWHDQAERHERGAGEGADGGGQGHAGGDEQGIDPGHRDLPSG
jgi:hypothetical protein